MIRWQRSAGHPKLALYHLTAVSALALLVLIVYGNSLNCPAVFDTEQYLSSTLLEAPLLYHISGGDRPVVNLSFALDYRIHGSDIRGYHIVNTLIHALAAMALYGVACQTFRILSATRKDLARSGRWLALIIAALWAVHPLNVASISYLIQRGESLMGLFYLLTLYCSIRAFRGAGPWSTGLWIVSATVFCSLGMGTKQVMISAPLLVFLYDYTFCSGSWKNAIRNHWCLYAGLATSWAPLVLISFKLFASQSDTCGFGVKSIAWYQYALSQPGVILHYLRLSFWPHPLCLDYMWLPARHISEIVIPLVPVAGLLALTFLGLWRRTWWGFLGAWFFFILALTSSFIPILDLAFEHRMYLSLMAVVVLVVLGVYRLQHWLGTRWAPARLVVRAMAMLVLAITLGGLAYGTIARNHDFRSSIAIWRDTVRKAPHNARAFYNYGLSLQRERQVTEAIAAYRQALEINPTLPDAHNNLGTLLREQGQDEEAAWHFEQAMGWDRRDYRAANNLARYYLARGNAYAALLCLRESTRRNPDSLPIQFMTAQLLEKHGLIDEAVTHYREALRIYPQCAEVQNNLALLLQKKGEIDEASRLCREALRSKPDSPIILNTMGGLLLSAGRLDEAIQHFQRALELVPGFAEAHNNLGLAFYQQGKRTEAHASFEKCNELDPNNVKLRLTQAHAMFQGGQYPEAIAAYHKVLEHDPDNRIALRQLAASYRATGDVGRADEYLDHLARTDSETAAEHYRQAKMFLQGNDFDMAIIHLGLGLRAEPKSREILLETAWLLAVHPEARYRDANGALQFAQRALEVSGENDPIPCKVLAAAYASQGDYARAVAEAEKALALLKNQGLEASSSTVPEMLDLFKQGKPYRQLPCAPKLGTDRNSSQWDNPQAGPGAVVPRNHLSPPLLATPLFRPQREGEGVRGLIVHPECRDGKWRRAVRERAPPA
jgi:tetratricopeptide (TPR) repeat protein